MKKLLSILLALTLVLALGVTAFAQDVPATDPDDDGATITIENAAKGETYTVYQIFDATVTGTEGGSIAYQLMTGKTLPPATTDVVFTVDDAGNVKSSNTNADLSGMNLDSEDIDVLIKYGTQVATAVSDGSTLTFTGLAYGYYLVTTSQGESLVTVTSTNPDADVYDKNSTTPVKNPTKTADDDSVYVGQTVTYTACVTTSNYAGAGEEAEQIITYYIKDTLPAGVELIENAVQEIYVMEGTTKKTLTLQQFDKNSEIAIPWATLTTDVDGDGVYDEGDDAYTSLYANGAVLYVVYKAEVTSAVTYGSEGNKNTVQFTYQTVGNTEKEPYKDTDKAEEIVYTYAFAIQKVDEDGDNLAGAKFQIQGYSVQKLDDGVYVVTGKEEGSTGALECDENGKVYVFGVEKEDITLKETEAPAGYNKLIDDITVEKESLNTASVTIKTTETTTYYDADGNVVDKEVTGGSSETITTTGPSDAASIPAQKVENKRGTELPSTGGIGTTIFTVVGIVLMAGAAILLITKKRMEGKENN